MPLADICASLLWKLDEFTFEIWLKIKLHSWVPRFLRDRHPR
jgi:hypothetical protein